MCGTQKDAKDTTLYLVDFGSFKKVGITQQPLEERFKQDKNFKILDTVIMDPDDAAETESEILKNMREFLVIGDIRRGKTECFVFDCTLLDDLF